MKKHLNKYPYLVIAMILIVLVASGCQPSVLAEETTFDAARAADYETVRWEAMGRFYEKQGLLNEINAADREDDVVGGPSWFATADTYNNYHQMLNGQFANDSKDDETTKEKLPATADSFATYTDRYWQMAEESAQKSTEIDNYVSYTDRYWEMAAESDNSQADTVHFTLDPVETEFHQSRLPYVGNVSEDVVSRLLDELNAGNIRAAAAIFADDAIVENNLRQEVYTGKDDLSQYLETMVRDGLQYQIVRVKYHPNHVELDIEISDYGRVWGTRTIEVTTSFNKILSLAITKFRLNDDMQ